MAAEQIYSHGDNEAKLKAALRNLQNAGFNLDYETLRAAVEQAVYEIKGEQQIAEALVRMSEELGVGLVATNDVHYVRKEDALIQDVLMCIQTGKKQDDEDRMRFSGTEFYIKSGDEMAELFPYAPDAIANTVKIAEACSFEFKFGDHHLPKFPLEEGQESETVFRQMCRDGYKVRYPDDPEGLLETVYADLDRFFAVYGMGGDRYPVNIVKGDTERFEAHIIEITKDGITVTANDTEGVRRALIYIEDELRRSEAAFLVPRTVKLRL